MRLAEQQTRLFREAAPLAARQDIDWRANLLIPRALRTPPLSEGEIAKPQSRSECGTEVARVGSHRSSPVQPTPSHDRPLAEVKEHR